MILHSATPPANAKRMVLQMWCWSPAALLVLPIIVLSPWGGQYNDRPPNGATIEPNGTGTDSRCAGVT